MGVPPVRKLVGLFWLGLLVVGCAHGTADLVKPEPVAKSSPAPEISDSLAFASEFVKALVRTGVHVRKVTGTTFDSWLPGVRQAAGIGTELGDATVFVFPGSRDAEAVQVTPETHPERGGFYYRVSWGEVSRSIGSVHQLYFIERGRYLVIADNPDLESAIRRALQET